LNQDDLRVEAPAFRRAVSGDRLGWPAERITGVPNTLPPQDLNRVLSLAASDRVTGSRWRGEPHH